eukprot:GILJ01003869.1.p1 GENE.GILJ01003869.1~~GILJ01003869.1.p1  ORF type:complete len:302 (+),score=41.84 GILJ01003869.1:112-1017(+)
MNRMKKQRDPVWLSAILWLVLVLCSNGVEAYKAVLLMHGIQAGPSSMNALANMIQESHPGTTVVNIDMFNDRWAYTPLWLQAKGLKAQLEALQRLPAFADGYHLVCHSQGALICRAAIKLYTDHRIHTFISLAGPNNGVYGPYWLDKYWPKFTVPKVAYVVYNTLAQHLSSIANMWHDPAKRSLYLHRNSFLPVLNNEVQHAQSEQFKNNFLRLSKFVVLGGEDDDYISPVASIFFGFTSENGADEIIDMASQEFFKTDSFGLKTLNDTGRLTVTKAVHASHESWVKDIDLFNQHIEKHLI